MDRSDDLNWLSCVLHSHLAGSSRGSGFAGADAELCAADFLALPPTVTEGALDGWERAVVS